MESDHWTRLLHRPCLRTIEGSILVLRRLLIDEALLVATREARSQADTHHLVLAQRDMILRLVKELQRSDRPHARRLETTSTPDVRELR